MILGKFNQRQRIIFSLLAITLVAVYFAPPEQEEVIEANTKAKAQIHQTQDVAVNLSEKHNQVLLIKERHWIVDKDQNLFQAKTKPVPVAITPTIQPPPKPIAPPLPFAYVGKVIEDGKLTVFVSKQQKNYFLKGGEVIDGTYKVDRVEVGQVKFTYLPLETEQVMTFGGRD